jgi:hypothetical protein
MGLGFVLSQDCLHACGHAKVATDCSVRETAIEANKPGCRTIAACQILLVVRRDHGPEGRIGIGIDWPVQTQPPYRKRGQCTKRLACSFTTYMQDALACSIMLHCRDYGDRPKVGGPSNHYTI